MLKKLTALLTAAVIIITCFSACGSDDKSNKPFACAVEEMPQHFDPQIAKTNSERMVSVNLFDGLFKLDENGEPIKCAASDYTVSADGLTYTFTVRDGLKYFVSSSAKKFIEEQGGKIPSAVTSEDFLFGIVRACLPETDAPMYSLLSAIKNADKVHSGELPASELGVKAPDSRTLVITLERKEPQFLCALSQPVSFPCNREFFELTKGRYGLGTKYTISNGAFFLSNISDDTSVRIEKNQEYSGEFAALPSSVTFYLNSDSTDSAKKVDKGTYDFGFFISESSKKELGRKVRITELRNTSISLVFNMKNENMQNLNLRLGLLSSIERADTEVKNLLPPYYKAAGEKIEQNIETLPYNVASARENIKTAFTELGKKNLTVRILCTEEYNDIAKQVVSSWQKNIGVELNGTVIAVKPEEFNKKIRSGEYDLAIYPLSADSDNAVAFLSQFKTDNIFGYSSEEYDRLFNELLKCPDGDKAAACQSHLLKNAVALPLLYDSTYFAVAKDVSGVYFAGDSSNVYFYKGQK